MRMVTCKKKFTGFPAAHRLHKHDGHCRLLHGHNWDIELEFQAKALDQCGFVIDFGKLGFIKDMLARWFDHTLILSEDDPELDRFSDMATSGLCKVLVVPDCSCEGLAKEVWRGLEAEVSSNTEHRVFLIAVTIYEGKQNSVRFVPGT